MIFFSNLPLILQHLLYIYFTGGRGYLQEVWANYRNYDVVVTRTKYNATYPVQSNKTIEYGVQDFSSKHKYEDRTTSTRRRIMVQIAHNMESRQVESKIDA